MGICLVFLQCNVYVYVLTYLLMDDIEIFFVV